MKFLDKIKDLFIDEEEVIETKEIEIDEKEEGNDVTNEKVSCVIHVFNPVFTSCSI